MLVASSVERGTLGSGRRTGPPGQARERVGQRVLIRGAVGVLIHRGADLDLVGGDLVESTEIDQLRG